MLPGSLIRLTDIDITLDDSSVRTFSDCEIQ